jgi:hypothetical protein
VTWCEEILRDTVLLGDEWGGPEARYPRPAHEPAVWVCDNCGHRNGFERKRCSDCRTSRY